MKMRQSAPCEIFDPAGMKAQYAYQEHASTVKAEPLLRDDTCAHVSNALSGSSTSPSSRPRGTFPRKDSSPVHRHKLHGREKCTMYTSFTSLCMLVLCVTSAYGFTPKSTLEMKYALSKDATRAIVSSWNTSNVTSLKKMFYQEDRFNKKINGWDVSRVTTLDRTFWTAERFNKPLYLWDVARVTSLSMTFSEASRFDKPLKKWDVAKVTSLYMTFYSAHEFNQPIGGWDVAKVTRLTRTFYSAYKFNQPIGEWDVARVTSLYGTFWRAETFSQNLTNWDTARVTSLWRTFMYAFRFDQDIGEWDVSKVTSLESVFSSGYSFTQPIGKWDVSKVTSLKNAFFAQLDFNQPIGKWDVARAISLEGAFQYASNFNQAIGEWDVSRVTSLQSVLDAVLDFNQPIGKWDVAKVTDLSFALRGAISFNQPISQWCVDNVSLMHAFMYRASSFNQSSWCTPSWGRSTFPHQGYAGVISGRVVCCMEREYFDGDKCRECKPGRYKSIRYHRNTSCTKCPAGWSSAADSLSCLPCAKGKFSDNPGTQCTECPAGFFQSKDTSTSTKCNICPAGYEQTNTGESLCLSLKKKRPEDCSMEQYLNDTDEEWSNWKCQSCPEGSFCVESTTWGTLGPKFGWWKIPANERKNYWLDVFAECIYPPACLGGPNPMLKGQFLDSNFSDLSLSDAWRSRRNVSSGEGACSIELGFKNSSRLCHACASSFRRSGAAQCAWCPKKSQNWGLILLGALLIFLVFLYLIHSTLNEGSEEDVSQGVQKIMLNYLQVISLARSFPLHWPPQLETLFEFQGALSTLGEHLVNFDCVGEIHSGALLFYRKEIAYTIFPPVVSLAAFIYWYTYGKCMGTPFFAKRANEGQKTPKDKFIVSVTTITFLIYPTLCRQAFSHFSCRRIGKYQYLHADLQEQCYVGRHLSYVVSLGIAQLLAYVLGLPALVILFLRRNLKNTNVEHEHRRTLDPLRSEVTVTRWGLFFKSYKSSRYYWEIVITYRKVFVVALSVFGKDLGVQLQSLMAILLIFFCASLELIGQPYREATVAHGVLPRMEVSALSVEWVTIWCGLTIYNTDDRFEGMRIFLTMFAIAANVCLLLWMMKVLIKSYLDENPGLTFGRSLHSLFRRNTWDQFSNSSSISRINPLQNGMHSKEKKPLQTGASSEVEMVTEMP